MPSSIFVQLLWIAIVGSSGYAWFCGGPAEKFGAFLFVSAAILSLAVTRMVLPEYIQIVGLGLDLAFSVAFLFFVVRFGSYWLGGIMLVQAGQFTLHAYYLVLERPQDRLHAIFNNVGVLMSVGLLVFGTYLHRRTDRLATD